MLPALAAAATLLFTNILLVDLMVTVRKGFSFWTQWKDLFVFETIQESGLMPVGLLGALLFAQAWWAPVIVIIPAVLAYYGFHHSVSEAAQKAQLADRLQNSLNELRELQAQLINSAKMASVGNLATGIAHEINNPVFAISGRADLLIKGAQKHLGSQKAVDYVNDISQMALRISSITNHLMAYAQNSGDEQTVFLNEVMESSITLLGNKTKRVKIIRDYQDVPVVDAVPSQLQQVFLNLITNAIDASPEWASISVGCSVDDEYAIAYVKDEGVGIPDDIQDRLFEPFVTSKDVDNRVGMGLGMYTCHRVIDGLSGNISVDSTLGKGTTIKVMVPLSSQSQYNWDDEVDFPDEEFESLAGN